MHDNIVMKFKKCPRCNWEALEELKAYSYCINCNYNSVEDNCKHLKKRKKKKKSKSFVKLDIERIREVQDQLQKAEKI
ncbi:MAG: hypothetical protein OXB88_06570 [Bacteriovoracales bacterium]|nr:hypothetical protein [Bacteriovoracales bacterium]